jgi:polar amino acid transport system substrate-binding protein
MRKLTLIALTGTVALAACGSDKAETAPTTAAKPADSTAPAAVTTAAPADTTASAATTVPAETVAPADTTAPAGDGAVDCKPIKPGVLTVVTSLPGPNFWGSGELEINDISSGIEFDLATKVAEICGLKMEFRNESFDAIVAGQIGSDTYDIAFSQVTIREEREKVVDFTVPYFKSDQGILVKAGTPVTSFADLAKLKVGVQTTTTAEYYFSADGPWAGKLEADAQSFPDLTAAYAALNAGQIDAVVIDTPINLGQAAQSNGDLEVPAQIVTGEEYGAILPEGAPTRAIFDEIIKGLNDDGTVNGLIAKYLGGDPSKVAVIEVP